MTTIEHQSLPGTYLLEGGPEAAALEVYMLCDAVAADRRANPRGDIMTALVQAEIDGERLSDPELKLLFVTLIVAGNETTRNLVNHSRLALIDHPEQADRLRRDRSRDQGHHAPDSRAPRRHRAGRPAGPPQVRFRQRHQEDAGPLHPYRRPPELARRP